MARCALYDTQEFKNLKNNLANLRKEMLANLPAIRSDIEEIITLKDRNGARIEQHLDTLLGYMEFGLGVRDFAMLNEYYKEVDPEAHKFYKQEYEQYIRNNQ